MKSLLLIAVTMFAVGCGGKAPDAETRSAEAEFVSVNENEVTLKLKSGKVFEVGSSVKTKFEYEIKDGTVTITGSDYFTHEEFIIPAKIEGKPVTNIGKKAFQASELTSITIPDSVTSIGEHAFRASDLTSMKIPDSVTSIGDKAFSTCINLTSITIPHSVTSIGDEAFSQCESLTSITIPHSVPSIGYWAFQNCISLAAVTFLGNAPKVDPNVFAGSTPTIYRKPEAKGWGDTWGGRPVKLISEKP